MFKENFKAAFGWMLGMGAGLIALDWISGVLKQANKSDNKEEKQEEEKSKADVWDESVK